jgi:hypothetical protein
MLSVLVTHRARDPPICTDRLPSPLAARAAHNGLIWHAMLARSTASMPAGSAPGGADADTAITLSARQPVKQAGLREQGEAVGHSPVLDDLAAGDAG